MSIKKIETLTKRIQYEDSVLNTRTGIVLTFNGLMAIAVSQNLPGCPKFIASLIVFILNLLWLTCSIEAWLVIRSLIRPIRKAKYKTIDERIRLMVLNSYLRIGLKRLRIGPTKLFGVVMPLLLVVGWGAYLVYLKMAS